LPPVAEPKSLNFSCINAGTTFLFVNVVMSSSWTGVRFAALKLSAGGMDRLRKAIELAKTDWRDLLVAAEFANDVNAHKRWSPLSRPDEGK
jgi:hypothetical protein